MPIPQPLKFIACVRCRERRVDLEMVAQPSLAEVQARARAKVRWSHWLFGLTFGIGSLILAAGFAYALTHDRFAGDVGGLGPRQLAIIGLGEVLLSAYIVWTAFWGVPIVWRLWRRLGEASSAFPVFRWLRAGLPISIPAYVALYSAVLGVGMFYGAIGGGVYEYARNRRLASRRVSTPDAGASIE